MVPVPLVATVGVGGITETAVTARESLIVDREDANATKLLQRGAHSSESDPEQLVQEVPDRFQNECTAAAR